MPRHIDPPLPCFSRTPSFVPPVPSFLSASTESIHRLIDSALLLSPSQSHQVRKAVDFFLRNPLHTVGINFPSLPSSTDSPLTPCERNLVFYFRLISSPFLLLLGCPENLDFIINCKVFRARSVMLLLLFLFSFL